MAAPAVVGEKVTLIVQLPLVGFTELPQLLVSAKGPVTWTLEICKARAPEFERDTVCAELVVPGCWSGNERLAGDSAADAWAPCPVS